MVTLLSYGEVLVDFLPNKADASYYPLAGGAPANVAVAYAKLGGKSYFAGGISTDDFGTMLMQKLAHESVDTAYVNTVEHANTAIVLVTLDSAGERSFNFYRHHTADMHYKNHDVDKIDWQKINIFHFCSNTMTNNELHENTLYAIKQARAANVLVSFDVNLRQQLWHNVNELPNRVEQCIAQSDIIKLSKDEALYLANIKQLEFSEYINTLSSLGDKLIVITDGPNSIQATNAQNYSLLIDVPKITAVDTTAAGDSFIASFLFALAQQAQSNQCDVSTLIRDQGVVSSAILFASKCGAFTCQHIGAFDALPTLSEL